MLSGLSQSALFMAFAASFAIFFSCYGKHEAGVFAIPVICLVHFDPLFVLPAIWALWFVTDSVKIRLFAACEGLTYLALNLLEYPWKILFLWWYGLPQTILCALVLYLAARKLAGFSRFVPHVVFTLVLVLYGACLLASRVYAPVEHVGFAPDSDNTIVVSHNSLKNAVPSGKYSLRGDFANFSDWREDTGYSVFLPDYGSDIEKFLRTDERVRGTFYLFGEHDNYDGFIGEDSRFNDGSTFQHMPWAYNRPHVQPTLQAAALRDYFFASNLGTTIRHIGSIMPVVWKYEDLGRPVILVGKEILDDRILYYFGDSDPLVSFLAPYNPHILAALYGHDDNGPYLRIAIVVALGIVLLRTVRRVARFSAIYGACLLMGLSLVFTRTENVNSFDCQVDFVGCEVVSPHLDNHPASIIKEMVSQGHTVTSNLVNSPRAKLLLTVVSREGIAVVADDKRRIVFLADNAEVEVNGKTVRADDTPMGPVNVGELVVPDARLLEGCESEAGNGGGNGVICQAGNVIVVGTGSPQRFASYAGVFDYAMRMEKEDGTPRGGAQ